MKPANNAGFGGIKTFVMSLVISSNGKIGNNKLEKQYLEVIVSGGIHESQIISLRKAMRNDKVDASVIIVAVKKINGGLALEAKQNSKGYNYCMNAWKTKSGGERKNNPFSARQQDILTEFSHFTLVDFAFVTNGYWKQYYPIYRCYGKSGKYFDYYYNLSGAEWNIL